MRIDDPQPGGDGDEAVFSASSPLNEEMIVRGFRTAGIVLLLALAGTLIFLRPGEPSENHQPSTDAATRGVGQAHKVKARLDSLTRGKDRNGFHMAFSAGVGPPLESAPPLRHAPKRRGAAPVVSNARGLLDTVQFSDDAEARIHAIVGLSASLKLKEVFQTLEGALDDRHEGVRMTALNILSTSDDPAVFPILSRVEISDPSPVIRERAASLLRYLSTPPEQATP